MPPLCSATKNIVDGTAREFHLSYSHIAINGEEVVCIVAIGDSTGGSVEITQTLQTFPMNMEELKAKLPCPEALTFDAESGRWDFSILTKLAWVHTADRAPR
jgi:hypothetical protein